MINFKTVSKLNIVHLVHLTIIFLVLIVINVLVIKKTLTIKLDHALTANSENVMLLLKDELLEIETICGIYSEILNQYNTYEYDHLLQNLYLNENVDSFLLYDSDGNKNNSWNISNKKEFKNSFEYTCQLSNNKILEVRLKENWVDSLLSQIKHDPAFEFGLLGPGNSVYYTSLEDSSFSFSSINYLKRNQIHLFDESKNRFAKFSNCELLDLQFVAYFNLSFSAYLKRYFKIFLFELFIVLLLIISTVMRTNRKYTKGFSDIVSNLADNKYFNVKNSSTVNEAIIIQRCIDAMQSQLDFYAENLENSSAKKLKMEKDLQIAKQLQKNILPVQTPEIANRVEFEIFATSEAAFDLGGDLYDYFMLNEKELMIVVADVAGKGIPASLFMIFTQTLLRSIAKSGLAVNEIAETLNSKLIKENISDLFVTMFMGVLNLESGKFTYTNAAHNLPLLIQHDGVIVELKETHGIPLGIYANRHYKYSEVQFQDGDQLLVYTDGLIDAKDENDMNFTVDVLKYNLMGAWFRNPEEVVTKIEKELKSFCGTVDPVDDTTLLMLKFKNGVKA